MRLKDLPIEVLISFKTNLQGLCVALYGDESTSTLTSEPAVNSTMTWPTEAGTTNQRFTIGYRIQISRIALGLSEDDLANKLNTYSDHISDWECGITEPSASVVIPLASALKCDPMWLLTGNATHQSSATPAHQSRHRYSGQLRSDASDHASHHARNPSQV